MALEKSTKNWPKPWRAALNQSFAGMFLRNVIIGGGSLPRNQNPSNHLWFFEALHFLSMAELTPKQNKHPLNGEESSQWQKANTQQNNDQWWSRFLLSSSTSTSTLHFPCDNGLAPSQSGGRHAPLVNPSSLCVPSNRCGRGELFTIRSLSPPYGFCWGSYERYCSRCWFQPIWKIWDKMDHLPK